MTPEILPGVALTRKFIHTHTALSMEEWDHLGRAVVGHSGLCGCMPSCRYLWQAVLAVAPNFGGGNWQSEVPDAVTILRALAHADGEHQTRRRGTVLRFRQRTRGGVRCS